MKKLLIILLIASGCSTHRYIASVRDVELKIVKTDDIQVVQNMVEKYLVLNVDSALTESKHFEYYSPVLHIYVQKNHK